MKSELLLDQPSLAADALAFIDGGILLAEVSTAHAQGVLKIGMTASDLPITTGNPDRGIG